MQPEDHVAVAAPAVLPKRYFIPKAPSPAARPTAKARQGGMEAPGHRTSLGRLRAAALPFGVKCRFGRAAEAATAACSSGCIYIGVVRALAWVLTASIDVPVARYLPARISRCACNDSRWARSPK